MKRLVLSLVLVLTTPACVIVPQTVENSIRTNVAVGVNVLGKWDGLTDDQKKQAYWKQTRAMVDLDYSVNGTAIPAEFQNDPWAKKSDQPAAPEKK